MFEVQGFGFTSEQLCQTHDTFLPARWALVDVGHTTGHGLGVAGAIGVSAALTLGLRQSIKQPGRNTRHTAPQGLAHARVRRALLRAAVLRAGAWVTAFTV